MADGSLIRPRGMTKFVRACIIHAEMASNELARPCRLLVYNGICAVRPISGGIKQRSRWVTYNRPSHSIYRIHPLSVSNSSRSSLGGSKTELKMSQTHTQTWLTTDRAGLYPPAMATNRRRARNQLRPNLPSSSLGSPYYCAKIVRKKSQNSKSFDRPR